MKLDISPGAAELRRCAEKRLAKQHPELRPPQTETDSRRLLHELEVHQIELEMQNAMLRESGDRMETLLEKYTELYDFAPVGFLTLDGEGAIQEANLTAAGLLGIERSRLIKRRLGLCMATADRPAFAAFLTRVFESQVREFCEVTLLTEGRPPVKARIEAAVAAAGQECRAVLEDITAHKRAERDRLILNKLEATGILAGGIAHDFNNLLTVILLHIDLAQMQTPPNEELAGHLKLVEKAVGMARSLTHQLITFAEGGAPIRKPTSLSGVVQASAQAAVSGSRIRCELSLADDLWSGVVDAEQIGQVIRNVVLNAREAMPAGGVVSVRAENRVLASPGQATLPPGDYVRVSIADQGGGIAEDVLPKIFDPYFSTKQRGDQKGMGLGLTICHAIIQKHGGEISVASTTGAGTTFHIHLPASRKAVGKKPASLPEALPRPARILVMDDEEAVRQVIGMALTRMGYEVELVEDGQLAVEVYQGAKGQKRRFDAVLLDLTVRGGVGGQEAIQALLKIDRAVKAIVMSGYANDPVLMDPARYGFKAAVTKPFDRGELRAVLARVLEPAARKAS